MGLRTILGLPPKTNAPAQPTAPPPPARSVWDKAVVKYDTLVADPRYKMLSDTHKAALDVAWTNANAFAAANKFDDARAILVPAIMVAANHAVAPNNSRQVFDQAKVKAGGLVEAAALLGVASDHVKAMRQQYTQVSLQEKVNITVAARGMADLAEALRTDPQILAAKAARDRHTRERPGLDAEIALVLKTPPETPAVARALRQLPAVQKEIGKAAGALNFVEACVQIDWCNKLVAEIKADAAAIAAAVALRDTVLLERKKLDAKVNEARLVTGAAPEHKVVVAAFKAADDGYYVSLRDKNYERAKFEVGRLELAADRVIDMKPACESGRRALDAKVEAQRIKIAPIWKKCELVPPVTAEMTAAQKAYKDIWKNRDYALADDDYPKALQLGDDLFSAMQAYLQLGTQNTDATRLHSEAERCWNEDLKPRFDSLIGVEIRSDLLAKAFAAAHGLGEDAQALFAAKDYAGFNAKVPDLKKALDEFDRLKPLDQEMADSVKKASEGFAKIKSRAEAIAQSKVATRAFGERQNSVVTAMNEVVRLIRACEPGSEDLIPLLNDWVSEAEKLKADNDSKIDAKKAEVQQILRPGLTRIFDAIALLGDHLPYSADLHKMFVQNRDRIEDAFATGKFDTARELFEAFENSIGLAAGGVPGWTADATRDQQAVTTRWNAIAANLQAVLAFDPITPGLVGLRDSVTKAEAAFRPFFDGQSWAKALVEIGPLEQAVRNMKAQEATYAQLKANYDAMTLAATASRAEAELALREKVNQPATKDIQVRMEAALETAKRTEAAFQFAASRAAWAEVARQLVAWRNVPPDQFGAPPERAEALRRFNVIADDYKACGNITPVPTSLKPLVNAYAKAKSAFLAAYYTPDWPAALALIGPLEKAVTELAPKAQENAAARTAARPAASAALATITNTSVENLKKMPVKDRLGLLDRLRGEGAKLDKAQRKAQRQIYASLTYDDDFKVLDDERQDKLSQELGADPDLKDAKKGWAAKSVEDRMKVLQKVLAAECRVYNVPMPEVRLFNAKNPNGFFSDANGTININIRPGGGFDDFQRVMNTMLHENAHNLQYVLIQRLEEGILKPGDPEFNQALVFAANLGGDGYVSSKEDRVIEDDEPVKTAYKNQPAEMHAWDTGGKVSAKILEILQGLDTPAKNVSL